MIYCKACAKESMSWFTFKDDTSKREALRKDQSDWVHAGWYPVDEAKLPVNLPDIKDYIPKGEGRGPLADHPEFYQVACPECGAAARRETDVSDTFLDSAWYFFRYTSTEFKDKAFDLVHPVTPEKLLIPSKPFFRNRKNVISLTNPEKIKSFMKQIGVLHRAKDPLSFQQGELKALHGD